MCVCLCVGAKMYLNVGQMKIILYEIKFKSFEKMNTLMKCSFSFKTGMYVRCRASPRSSARSRARHAVRSNGNVSLPGRLLIGY